MELKHICLFNAIEILYRNHIDFTKPKREPKKQISDIQM